MDGSAPQAEGQGPAEPGAPEAAGDAPETAGGDLAAAGEQGSPGPAAVAEPPEQMAQRLERETAEWKDRALRAAADLENFRKRARREREEQFARGQAEVLARIIEVIDDLARVAHLDPEQTTAPALHEGMLQIERKFLKTLDAAGLERIDPMDQRFDPNVAEAVTVLPAGSPDEDHTVGGVLQAGYRLRGVLLRPARVAVRAWREPVEESAGTGEPGPDA